MIFLVVALSCTNPDRPPVRLQSVTESAQKWAESLNMHGAFATCMHTADFYSECNVRWGTDLYRLSCTRDSCKQEPEIIRK